MDKSDSELKRAIENELRDDAGVNEAQIGVSVDRGTVVLHGEVDNYSEKWAAEAAVKRVLGVRTIAQDLEVKVPGTHSGDDRDIAAAAHDTLTWDVSVPKTVIATVEHGSVSLEGEVASLAQRQAAEHAVHYLRGAVAIENSITVASPRADKRA